MPSKTITLHFMDDTGCESYPTREYDTVKEARAAMKEHAKSKEFFNTRAESPNGWESCVEIHLCVNGEVTADTRTAWYQDIAKEKDLSELPGSGLNLRNEQHADYESDLEDHDLGDMDPA